MSITSRNHPKREPHRGDTPPDSPVDVYSSPLHDPPEPDPADYLSEYDFEVEDSAAPAESETPSETDAGAVPDKKRGSRPGIVLTDTRPDEVFAQSTVNDDGEEVEPPLRDYLAQTLLKPPVTVQATHKQVGGAVAALLDGRIRYLAEEDAFYAWTGETWKKVTPAEVSTAIKGLIGREDAEGSATRAIIPFEQRKITRELEDIMLASGYFHLSSQGDLVDENGTEVRSLPVTADIWAESTDTAARIREDLRGRPSVVLDAAFDTHPYVINARGTLLDISRSMLDGVEAHALSRHDLVSRTMGTAFDPTATAPLWERFISEVTGYKDPTTGLVVPRPELARYLQVLAGLTLVGEVVEQVVLVLHGLLGSNGKSVFMNVLLGVFGTYGTVAPKALILEKRMETHTTDLTVLRGSRLAYIKEPTRNNWDAEMVKDLGSEEPLMGRKMRQDNTPWSPTHTAWISTNNEPRTAASDAAFWRRIKMLPFAQRWYRDGDRPSEIQVSIAPIDPTLTAKLRAEAPGILNWLLEGLATYYADGGLVEPPCVTEATEEARRGTSLFTDFIANAVERGGDDNTVGAMELWKMWVAFRDREAQTSMTAPTDKKKMVTAFLTEVPTAKHVRNEPGKRNVAEHFSGVVLTEVGQAWKAALGRDRSTTSTGIVLGGSFGGRPPLAPAQGETA